MADALIVIFGVALFCLLVVLLMPASMRAKCSNRRVGPQPERPEITMTPHSPATGSKAGPLETELCALPYRLPEVRLPEMPEPSFHNNFKVGSLLPFPASILSLVESCGTGAKMRPPAAR